MHFAPHFSRRSYLATLLALVASVAADQAAGQPTMRTTATASRQVRPSVSGARAPVRVSRPSRLASHSRVVTEDEIVEGATYLEDPETGQLLETDGSLPLQPQRAQPEMMSEGYGKGMSQGMVKGGGYVEGVEVLGDEFVGEYGDSCGDACLAPCDVLPVGNLEFFAGVEGFTGPRNRGGSSSFGFHEGLNWAVPLPGFSCMGGQVGFRATQSSLSGAGFTDSTREQAFVTAGLFRRVDVGLQGGLVVDYMTDSWYSDVDLVNLRGEISWMINGVHDLGFWMTGGTKTSEADSPDGDDLEEWASTDLYAFFYRLNFGGCRDGDARLFAGWTGQSDGLIGIDARLPLGADWALETNFAYLIPNESSGTGFDAGHTQEAWNIGISLVWYPGQFFGQGDYYYRPLFRVADNGTFMVDRE